MKIKPNIASMEAYVPGRTVPGAVKLSSNENPLGPSPLAIAAIRDVLDGVHRYPDGASTELKDVLAARWSLNRENLLVANGSDEVFNLLTAASVSPGDNAVGIRETFSEYRFAVTLFGGEMREAHVTDGMFPLEDMLALTDADTRMIFLCNPNNPTGTYRTHGEVVEFLKKAPPQAVVVMDEAYADFADEADFPDARMLLDEFPNLVVTRTFSKLYGLAGLRVGYAAGAADIIGGAERASMPFNVNNLAQAAALAALGDEEHRRRTLDLVRSERVFMAEELDRRGLSRYPSQANFVCFDIGRKVADVWEAIAERGIAVRDLKSFGLPSMIRYTYGERRENERLLTILDELP